MGSKRAVARELEMPESTVRKYLDREFGKAAPSDIRHQVDPVEAAKKRIEDEAKRREHVDAVNELAFRDFLRNLVEDNVGLLPRAPKPPKKLANPKAHERFPLLCLNDLHFEERVKSEGVLGLNEYSIPIACRRLYRVVQSAIHWRRDMEAGKRFVVPELTVALLGDFLTGTLHKLEQHSDAPHIVKAALACGDLLALALRDLAAEFPLVRVVGVSGNHGRLPDDKKMDTKNPTRSWDYLAYQVARRRLDGQENIEWNLPESYGVLFDVGGHLCYGAHGNFIPNQLGIVGYGIRRFASTLAGNLTAAGKRLKYCFFGHWHQSAAAEFAGLGTFICPSLIGAQEYGFLAGGSVNRPAQEMFVLDKEKGMTGREILYGDGEDYEGTYEVEV